MMTDCRPIFANERSASRAVICHAIIRPKRSPFLTSGAANVAGHATAQYTFERELGFRVKPSNDTEIVIPSGGCRVRSVKGIMPNTIKFASAEDHYGEDYFSEQRTFGWVAAKINKQFFEGYVEHFHTVVDFGCGGGFLLQELEVSRPIGVEVNPTARDHVRKLGIEVHESIESLEDEIADVIVSSHALEHVENPLAEIRSLYRKLKPEGRMVLLVPCDSATYPYYLRDRDFHLFSWSPNNLGNLLNCASMEVEDARIIRNALPGKWKVVLDTFGFSILRLTCHIRPLLPMKRRQIRVVARKPS